MARFAIIIVSLAAIGTALVHVRRREARLCCDIQSAQARQLRLRRKLWDRQVLTGELTRPAEVMRRADDMALDLIHEDPSRGSLAEGAGRSQ